MQVYKNASLATGSTGKVHKKNFTILFYQMDHIWGAPSGLKKSPKLTFLDK